MKVPPKRKGNLARAAYTDASARAASMKVPPKRKGNELVLNHGYRQDEASMKVPPKRKGNVNEVALYSVMSVPQ